MKYKCNKWRMIIKKQLIPAKQQTIAVKCIIYIKLF